MSETETALTNIRAERAAVGAMLIDSNAILQVQEWLEPSDFHTQANGWIYEGLRELASQGQIPDYVTIMNWLDDQGHLTEIGGAAYLSGLANSTPTAMGAENYARIVQRLGTLRRLTDVAGAIAKLAYSDNADVDAVFDRARALVDNAAPMYSDESVLLWLDSLDAFVDYQLERQAENVAIESGQLSARVVFPWAALRRYVKRCRGGMVGIVAAKSSVGKTVFQECCAESWAQAGLKVAFFHFELSHKVMIDRRTVRWSGMSMDEVENGVVDASTDKATAALRNWPGQITYVHCPGWTMGRVAAKIRKLHSKGICDVVVVDYLQKARMAYQHGENKAQATGAAVDMLKNTAEQLDIFVLLGAQFSNAANGTYRKTADSIRDSGEPAEKANIVITLDRPILDAEMRDDAGAVVANAGERSPLTTARTDKNTNGATGDSELYFNGARYAFYDRSQA